MGQGLKAMHGPHGLRVSPVLVAIAPRKAHRELGLPFGDPVEVFLTGLKQIPPQRERERE